MHAELLPWQFSRGARADDQDILAVHNEDIIFRFIRRGFLGADFAFKTALGGIVFEEIGEVIRRDDITHSDDFDIFTEESLFGDGAKHQAANGPRSTKNLR